MVHRAEVALAWVLLVGSLVGWPLSALSWARDEPQFILGLSWLAITLTAMDLLKTSRVHRDQGEETENASKV
jgi:hypothetical protein